MGTSLVNDGEPFDWPTAMRLGMRAGELKDLVAGGGVRQPLRGVYVDAAVTDDIGLRARCLALRLPPGAAVSRLSAAWLHGVDGLAPDQRGSLVVECTVPRGREPLSRPGVRCYVAPLGDDEVERVRGVPCTTGLRTTVDVLRWVQPHMALWIADALTGRGVSTPDDVVVAVERSRGCRGVRQARYLARIIDPRSESAGESWLRLRIVDAGFPRPEAQIVVAPDCCSYRIDLGWRHRRVGIEYDGEEFHASAGQAAHDERRREHLVRRHGWTVVGVGKGQVLGRSLELERGVGELLSLSPATIRRLW